MIDRDLILAPKPRRTKRVELPELGTYLLVRALNVSEMSVLHAALEATEDRADTAAAQLAAYAVDDAGEPVFTMETARKFVQEREWQICRRINNAGNELNSLNDEAVETARGN